MNEMLKFLMQQRPEGWEATAQSWLMAIIVIALLGAGAMFAFKAVKKLAAKTSNARPWSRGQTLGLIAVGLLLVPSVLALIWYFTSDYYEYVGGSGLLSGFFVSWVVYLIAMVLGHLVSPWRRELL